MKMYTDYNKVVYVMGVIDSIIKTDTKDLTVDAIKKILEGAKEVVENN